MHQRLVAFTQCYFTTLDRRRTLRTLRDCGLSRLKALCDAASPALGREVRQNAPSPLKLSCIDIAIDRWLNSAISTTSNKHLTFTRSETVICVD